MKITGDLGINREYQINTRVPDIQNKPLEMAMDRITLNKSESEPITDRNIPKPGEMSKTAEVGTFGSYAPEGKYLWDSWIFPDKVDGSNVESLNSGTGLKLKEGDTVYRLFHLDAPKTDDPEARHDKAQVRQAVSTDMKNWKDVDYALKSGPEGSWDDGPVWTGNVYKNDKGEYLFFYTGRNHRDGQMQRIGLAKSKDGVQWDRSDKPLLEPDGRYYETTEDSPIYKAWRDPCVVKDEQSGKYLMYFTAKTKEGDEKYKGCIGVAVADNLEGPYESLPPVLAPGKFAQMEVPQIIQRNDKVYLFFGSMEKDYSPDWAKETGGAQSGLHCYVGDSLTGPFEPLNGDGIVTGSKDNLYTVKLVDDPQRPGEFVAYGWYMEDKGGQKGMTLAQPMRVDWKGNDIRIDTGADRRDKAIAGDKSAAGVSAAPQSSAASAEIADTFVSPADIHETASSSDVYIPEDFKPEEVEGNFITTGALQRNVLQRSEDGGLTDKSTGLTADLKDDFRTMSVIEEKP